MSKNSNLLHQTWSLCTNPFCPTCDPHGKRLGDAFDPLRSLKPSDKDKLFYLFHDVYDWPNNPHIGQLSSTEGLGMFPDLDRIVANQEPLIVIVSGLNLSGVRSMTNLMRHKAKMASHILPVLFDARLGNQSNGGWAMSIAKHFIREYVKVADQPDENTLKKIYNDEVKGLEQNPEGYFSLPQLIREEIHSKVERPIVFQMSLRDNFNYEQLTSICEIAVELVDLIIIPTRNSVEAKSFYNANHEKWPVVHIQACYLDLSKAREYLAQRLSLYRTRHDLPDIAPFSDAALSKLFEPSSHNRHQPIKFPIGYVNRRLRAALEEHLQTAADQGQETKLIQEDLMKTIIERLNRESDN